ncbi:MAG TPA: tRNA (N6-threonylcarbamoyladenosine(37)-N6)-methyltransferase TrmO [Nitrososphaerales archaeon]|nr:tRNA (N6-threonylcarbamoyladenosine(37)-N6)-methyltransferase TrmO [Nitrososphaerales archaeon]
MTEIVLRPVGEVHTKATIDEIRNRAAGLESTVEVYPEFEAGLEGLEGFSHIFVLGYFHRLRPEQVGPLSVKPRGLIRYGFKLEELPTVGVFALDSPTRPNPIGLSLVPLIKKEGNKLTVSGLDYFDGTPVLDIKPYQSNYRVDGYKLPEWLTILLEKAGRV